MRQLTEAESSAMLARIDRALAQWVYRQNEFDRMVAALQGRNGLERMSTKLKALRGKLTSVVDKLNQTADDTGQSIDKAAERAHSAIQKANALGTEINATAAEIEAIIGQETNGPPA